MAEIIKGWLKTRDLDENGNPYRYAPATLVENVFTRAGVPYDSAVQGYVETLSNSINTQLTTVKQSLREHSDDIDALEREDTSIKQDIADKFANLNTENSAAFYIVDNNDNVVAYIDAEGIHAIEVEIPDVAKLSELPSIHNQITSIKNDISNINSAIENIDASSRDALYIIDNADPENPDNCNVIAMIDKEGVHSINFHADGTINYIELVAKVNTIESNLQELTDEFNEEKSSQAAKEAAQDTAIRDLQTNTQYFDGQSRDMLFITDGDGNTIAYFDKDGLHSINGIIGSQDDEHQYNLYQDLTTLFAKDISLDDDIAAVNSRLDEEISTRAAKDSSHDTSITELQENTQYFDGQSRDALFITDTSGNTIAYIDKEGLHTINALIGATDDEHQYNLYQDLTALFAKDASLDEDIISLNSRIDQEASTRSAKDASHDTAIAELQENTQYFNGESRDALYITDSNGYTIAYFNKDGFHSINGIIGGLDDEYQYNLYQDLTVLFAKDSSLDSDIEATNTRLNEEIAARQNADTSEKATREEWDTLLSSVTNFHKTQPAPSQAQDGDLWIDRNQLLRYNAINGTWESFDGLSQELKNKTQYFNGDASDKFYLIDSDNNVIAYFDNDGLHAVNVFVGNNTTGTDRTEAIHDVYTTLTQLLKDLSDEVSRSAGIDTSHGNRLTAIEGRLNNVENVMDFVGVFKILPAASAYQKGDVCVVGAKEYVHDGTDWQLLGDVSAEAAAISRLQEIVGDPGSTLTYTHEERLDSLEANLAVESSERKEADTNLNNYIIKVEDVVEDMNENFDWSSSRDTLFIVDGTNDENVLARFDASGLSIIDTTIVDTSTQKSKSLKQDGVYFLKQDSLEVTWPV